MDGAPLLPHRLWLALAIVIAAHPVTAAERVTSPRGETLVVEGFSSAARRPSGLALPMNRLLDFSIEANDVRVTFNGNPQNETTVAVDPFNTSVVVGGFNDYATNGNGVAYSSNGGASFTHLTSPQPIPLPGGFFSGGDPAVAFDSQHRVFYTHLGVGSGADFHQNSGVFCAKSVNGGANWSATVPVTQQLYTGTPVPFEDKSYLAADHYVASPFRDRLYVTWTRFYPGVHPNGGTGGGDIMAAYSTTNGASWTISGSITNVANLPGNGGTGNPGSSEVQGSKPAVAPNGDVYVAYFFSGRTNVSRSTDGGVTFAPPTTPFGNAPTSSFIGCPLPGLPFRCNSFPSMECDPTRPGYVYVVAPDAGATDPADIVFARSTDFGATWDARIKLNDDTGTANQVFPWIAVNDSGNVAVLWYDTRNDPASNHLMDVYYTMSRDGGATWSRNVRVTDQSFDCNTNQFSGNDFFGDYNGIGGGGSVFVGLWTDTRRPGSSPEQEIYAQRLGCMYRITASAGANGSISPAGAVAAGCGEDAVFTISPDANYHVSQVLADGVSVGTVTSYTFTNVSADHSITASFAINRFPVSVTAVGNGSVSKTPDLADYPYGSDVTLTATPAAGSHFVGWSGDASGSTNPLVITIVGPRSITATFSNLSTLSVTTAGSGTVQRSPDQAQYLDGTVVTLTAHPSAGWTFTGWSGDASGTDTVTTVTMNGDRSVTATFQLNAFTLTTVASGAGTIQRSPDLAQYPNGSTVQLTAVADPGNLFVGWTGDASGNTNPINVLMNANKSITGTFLQGYVLDVTIVGQGTVTKSPDQTAYLEGSIVSLSASPAAGWAFDQWSGDVSGDIPYLDVEIYSDVNVTATFHQGPVDVAAEPLAFALEPVRPNPAHGVTAFDFSLPRAARVRLSVVDVGGREIAKLVNGERPAGRHHVTWSAATTAHGQAVAGVYFVRLDGELGTRVRRFLVVP